MAEDEFCSSCGEWKPLIEDTGFCLTCSREYIPRLCVCSVCSNTFTSRDEQQRYICPRCNREQWLEQNADKIELYMRIGLTYRMAHLKVLSDNLPICNSCGNKIKGGQRGRHFFCLKTPQ